MIDKDIQKINKAFKIGKWAFVVNIIMSILSVIFTLITDKVEVIDYMAMAGSNIMCSIFLSFIFGHTSVSDVSKDKKE